MFVVKSLQPFPPGAQPFADSAEVDDVMQERGLRVNTSMCADCPPMSSSMEVPHYFAHVYAGLEMLYRGQEEVQMCGIVKQYVTENVNELKSDTAEYFSQGGPRSVMRYVNSMTKKFVPPSAALVYLMARACNAHTRVHFANCVWSTLDDNHAYYVAVELAAVGDHFLVLESLEQETLEVVVGEIKVLRDPGDEWLYAEVKPADVVSVSSSESGEFCASQSVMEQVVTKACAVQVQCLPIRQCFPQVYVKQYVKVEHLSRSMLTPGRVFRSEKTPKSVLYPGHVFCGQYDWRKCTVPQECPSVTVRKPGCVFSAREGPRDKLSVSSRKPGFVFSNRACPTPNWSQCTVPTDKPSRMRPQVLYTMLVTQFRLYSNQHCDASGSV